MKEENTFIGNLTFHDTWVKLSTVSIAGSPFSILAISQMV